MARLRDFEEPRARKHDGSALWGLGFRVWGLGFGV